MKEVSVDQNHVRSAKAISMDDLGKLHATDLDLASIRVLLEGESVGTLALADDGVLAFQYDDGWLKNGFSLSPFSLPLEPQVLFAKRHPLDGVFGIFADSMPDGWGRLLVDRKLRELEIDPFSVSPLARLAIVGRAGMGALEYEPEATIDTSRALDDLDEIAAECAAVLETGYSEDLDTLFAMGGSSGGTRPKILTKIDGADWIVKFPSSLDSKDIGLQEYEYAQAARRCGVEMPETRLLPSRICSGYFAIKRFDRAKDQFGCVHKTHMASVGALLETSHRIPNLDYDLLMRLTLRLTDDLLEVERLFRLMTFNVLFGNRDDHAKNFSFLHEPSMGSWTLAPGYDLTKNAGMNGEHATTVNGKGKDITREDMLQVALKAGIQRQSAQEIIETTTEIARETERTLHG